MSRFLSSSFRGRSRVLGSLLAFGVTGSILNYFPDRESRASSHWEGSGESGVEDAQLTASLPISPFALSNRRVKSRPKPILHHYNYVICGSGTAAFTALEAIRQLRPESSILLISEEQQMARLDIDREGPEELDSHLQDVYNEWRRHIACRLGTQESASQVVSGSAPTANVRKWGTRREEEAVSTEEEGKAARKGRKDVEEMSISLLIEDPSNLQIDPEDRTITLSDGSVLSYGKCVVAPPGKPRELYVLRSSISYTLKDKINALKDVEDFHTLQRAVQEGGKKIVVVGGGYLGTTLSSALVEMNSKVKEKNQIVQTYVESTPLQQYFPDYLCRHIMKVLNEKGVEFRPDSLVTAINKKPLQQGKESEDDEDDEEDNKVPTSDESTSKVQVTLMQGTEKDFLDCDYVVLASTNVNPDVEIAKQSGLEIDRKNGGIMCNSSLEVYDGLFVAGSSASYFDQSLGRRRLDFYDNALNMGLLAGQNMACIDGRIRQYTHQPTFRCTLPATDLQFEAVGEITTNLSTVGVWLSKRDESTGRPMSETAFERGIVYYVRANIVVGILCCNASECLDIARDIIRERLTVEEASSRIMLAPEQWVQKIKTR